MTKKIYMILVGLLIITGCTSIPERYANMEVISETQKYNNAGQLEKISTEKEVGWTVSDETDEGFFLDITYKEYVMTYPNSEEMKSAVDKFKEIASREAEKRGYIIKPVKRKDYNTSYHVGSLDGVALIQVTGMIYKETK